MSHKKFLTRSKQTMIKSFSWLFHDLLMTCSRVVNDLFLNWSWLPHDLMTCSKIVHDLLVLTSSQLAHDLFMTCTAACSWLNFFMICSCFVHGLVMVCSWLSIADSSRIYALFRTLFKKVQLVIRITILYWMLRWKKTPLLQMNSWQLDDSSIGPCPAIGQAKMLPDVGGRTFPQPSSPHHQSH